MTNAIFARKGENGHIQGVKFPRKSGIRYQYRDITTKRFLSAKEFKKRTRKTMRGLPLSAILNGADDAYMRQLIKENCNAEIIGVWFSATDTEYRISPAFEIVSGKVCRKGTPAKRSRKTKKGGAKI